MHHTHSSRLAGNMLLLSFLLLIQATITHAQSDTSGHRKSSYYKNGAVKTTGYYEGDSDQIKNGPFTSYRKDGSKESIVRYLHGKRQDSSMYYEPDGALTLIEMYDDNILQSRTGYFANGRLRRSEEYVNGKMKKGVLYDTTGQLLPFIPHKEWPRFNGNVNKFLANTMQYPDKAREKGITGRVILRFVVNTNGAISDIEVIKGANKYLDAESVRVISIMPPWIPGKVEGELVPISFTLPITFQLD